MKLVVAIMRWCCAVRYPSQAFVSRARRSVLHAASQNRDRTEHRRPRHRRLHQLDPAIDDIRRTAPPGRCVYRSERTAIPHRPRSGRTRDLARRVATGFAENDNGPDQRGTLRLCAGDRRRRRDLGRRGVVRRDVDPGVILSGRPGQPTRISQLSGQPLTPWNDLANI